MISDELLKQLHNLEPKDKLRVIELLAGDLVKAQSKLLTDGATYEVWSPYEAPEAAQSLLQLLEEDEQKRD